MTEWSFPDPRNVAVITVRQIVLEGHAILRVSHDADDGGWQFLEWETPGEKDTMLISLEEAVRLDPTLAELADLPLGWRACRRAPGEPWRREPNPDDGL